MATTTTVKTCSICGMDLNRKKRMKDARGAYFCHPCWAMRPQPSRGIPMAGPVFDTHPVQDASDVHGMPASNKRRTLTVGIAILGALIIVLVGVIITLVERERQKPNGSVEAVPVQPETPIYDVLKNPECLLNRAIPRNSYSVGGVKLGDPAAAILAARIKSNDGGAIACTDGVIYVVLDGKVAMITLPHLSLDQLALGDQSKAESILGQPDRREKNLMDDDVLYYDGHGLLVEWSGTRIMSAAIYSEESRQRDSAAKANQVGSPAMTQPQLTKDETIDADRLARWLIQKYPEMRGEMKYNSDLLGTKLTMLVTTGDLTAGESQHLRELTQKLASLPN